MTRLGDHVFRFSLRTSGQSGIFWRGLYLLVFLPGSVLAQDLAVPASAASQASLAASAAPAKQHISSTAAPALGLAKPTVASIYRWKNLSPAQQQALAPLEKDWGHLDQQRRRKWLEIAARFHSLPADERARMQERMSSWAKLSPMERSQARLIFQQAQQITPQSRQEKWEAYQALAPEQRQELADKATKRSIANNAPNSAILAKAGKRNALARKPALADQVKSNLVPDRTSAPLPKSVTPTLVQNKPGATTTLINQTTAPPAHQQSGLPKILAAPDLVDALTLLPKRAIATAPEDGSTIATPSRQ